MKILVIDTETGGLDPQKHSLLSIAGVMISDDNGWKMCELFNILVKEDTLHLEEAAMKVNKINILEHCAVALTPQQAVGRINMALAENFGVEKIVIAGHNVNFDIGFFKRLWEMGVTSDIESFSRKFSFRSIDTATIAYFLQLSGFGSKKESVNLDFFLKLANIEKEDNVRHTAIGDAILTAKALINILIKFSKFAIN